MQVTPTKPALYKTVGGIDYFRCKAAALTPIDQKNSVVGLIALN